MVFAFLMSYKKGQRRIQKTNMIHKAQDIYFLVLYGNLVKSSVLGAVAGREVDVAE